MYVIRFPSGEGKREVTFNSGSQPRWNGRGDELFYVADSKLMAVKVETGPVFRSENPQRLFALDPLIWLPGIGSYDVTSDRQRFVFGQAVEGTKPMITIVENWAKEFEEEP